MPSINTTTYESRALKKYALYLLSRRSYSEYELKKKLTQKYLRYIGARSLSGVENPNDQKQIIDKIITYLTDMALVDDVGYAQIVTESLMRQNKSSRYIKGKLMMKGFDKDLIATCLSLCGLESDFSRLRIVMKRVLSSGRFDVDDPKSKQKLMRYLAYRGFSFDDIKKVLGESNKAEKS
jgi:SOS response regulatory protein OraA/RecX